jgi:predicted MFS family arabinose efflux permease
VLYLIGGAVSLVAMRAAGLLVDRFGGVWVSIVGALLFIASVACGLGVEPSLIPAVVFFVSFMFGNSVRNVALLTVSSKVPAASERAGFGSVQSAAQHLGAAAGAALASGLLFERSGGALSGMPTVAALAIAVSLALPILVALVERHTKELPS